MYSGVFSLAAAAAVLILSQPASAQIPDAFSSGFDTKSTELKASFGSKEFKDGEVLSPADTSQVPKFALGGSSAISPKTKYTILMIDPDSPARDEDVSLQVVHYVKTDFSVTDQTNLNSESVPALKYVGADASTGTGPHRYIFLMYVQPEGFVVKGVPGEGQRAGFNVSEWRVTNGLKKAVAGVHFVATPPGGGSAVATSSAKVGNPGATGTTTPCATTTVIIGSPQGKEKTKASSYLSSYTSIKGITTTGASTHSAAPTQTGPATTHTVKVGGPSLLKYTPSSLIAGPGDQVVFDFLEKNHTVTQSTFDSPCVALTGGSRSGFRPNLDNVAGKETFTFSVTDTKPRWFFCAQGKHCQAGMVFAINPGTKFDEFVGRAKGNGSSSSSGSATTGKATGTVATTIGTLVPTTPAGTTAAKTTTARNATGTATSTATTTGPVFAGDAPGRVAMSGVAMLVAAVAALFV